MGGGRPGGGGEKGRKVPWWELEGQGRLQGWGPGPAWDSHLVAVVLRSH